MYVNGCYIFPIVRCLFVVCSFVIDWLKFINLWSDFYSHDLEISNAIWYLLVINNIINFRKVFHLHSKVSYTHCHFNCSSPPTYNHVLLHIIFVTNGWYYVLQMCNLTSHRSFVGFVQWSSSGLFEKFQFTGFWVINRGVGCFV